MSPQAAVSDRWWANRLTPHLKIGDRVRLYGSYGKARYGNTRDLGTIVGFKRDTTSGSLTGDYHYDPVVAADSGARNNTFVTRHWTPLDGRRPDPHRETAAYVPDSWVKVGDQTPNPDHADLVESAIARADPKQIEFRRPSLRQWLNECCEPDADAFTPNAHLFASWNVWAEANFGPFMPEDWLPQDLETLGFRPGQNEHIEGVIGLRFQADVAVWVADEAVKQAEREAQRELERNVRAASDRADTRYGERGSGLLGLLGLGIIILLVAAVMKWAWRMVFG